MQKETCMSRSNGRNVILLVPVHPLPPCLPLQLESAGSSPPQPPVPRLPRGPPPQHLPATLQGEMPKSSWKMRAHCTRTIGPADCFLPRDKNNYRKRIWSPYHDSPRPPHTVGFAQVTKLLHGLYLGHRRLSTQLSNPYFSRKNKQIRVPPTRR